MPAKYRPIYMEQGATYVWGFTLHEPGPDDENGQPTVGAERNLDGCRARMQVRRTLKADPAIDASTENSMIAISGGHIGILIPASETMKKTFEEGLYDIELIYPTEVAGGTQRLFEGPVTGTLNVTRELPSDTVAPVVEPAPVEPAP